MSIEDLSANPSFRAADETISDPLPISWLAVLALIAGVISLLAPLTKAMLVACAAAVLLGVVALVRIAKNRELTGARLAQIGTALGMITACWTIAAEAARNRYLFEQAGIHAEEFLETLAAGNRHEALELTLVEPDRQITGTNLEEYYSSDPERVRSSEGFFEDQGTLLVLEQGSEAQWKYLRGLRINTTGPNDLITVEMQNSKIPAMRLEVIMQRRTGILVVDEGDPTAHWNVYEFTALPPAD